MARPVTGRTPDNVRQAASLESLRKRGGDKIAARLEAESIEHLNAIKRALGPEASTTHAVVHALAVAASRKGAK